MRCGAHVRGFPLTCFWRFVQRLGLCSGAIFKLPSPGQHPFQRDDRGMETRGHKRKMRGGNIGCAGGMSSCKHGGRVNVRIQTSKAQHPFKGAHMQIPSITPHVKAQRCSIRLRSYYVMSTSLVLKAQRPVSLYCTVEP